MSQPPLPLLPLEDRSGLPYLPLYGEPLYLHGLRALVEAVDDAPVVAVAAADVERVGREVEAAGLAARVLPGADWWDLLRRTPGRGLLVHDPLCPLVPVSFLVEMVALAAADEGLSVAAYRPVTDTVKTAVDGCIEGTIDREQLAAVLSPIVVAAQVLTGAGSAAAPVETPPVGDLAELVRWSRERGRTELVLAPAMARRVDDESSVNLLECLDELGHQVRGAGARPPVRN